MNVTRISWIVRTARRRLGAFVAGHPIKDHPFDKGYGHALRDAQTLARYNITAEHFRVLDDGDTVYSSEGAQMAARVIGYGEHLTREQVARFIEVAPVALNRDKVIVALSDTNRQKWTYSEFVEWFL